ncbi:tRNA (adenosine(37)-N6)-dimethylallyltransferase MiaA [Candidatus Curtissbacteria bacterium RBG_16_39_7]|uniref:tRNA dimethylallyltransferase n=1 Tax=Candidatus Curtissbacteria bacterium RBG_16_39_7 TaxID=1797707 RepID=A0A1F5G4D5_9BACT|nr:MAG: tRNA (adenosine(37)-N6)-dimethylallyltransferase MiaA [Candidatus Curtissbacteria bacterium RBG_16_39_7]
MKKLIVVCGPTTTGKTDLALQLAKKFGGELISADSRQVYVGMDIGTGKFSFGDEFRKFHGCWLLNDVWIYGYDLVRPDEQFTVAGFVDFFGKTSTKIWQKGKLPILVGGTGFYIKSVLDGIDALGIRPDWQLRGELEGLTPEQLQEKLRSLDLKKWEMMNKSDRKNSRRLIRAIEIASSKRAKAKNEKTISHKRLMINALIIGLRAPRNFLYKKTDLWVQERLEKGLIKEVEGLIKKGYKDRMPMQGIIYKSVVSFIDGKSNIKELEEKLKSQMHDYSRRQTTWFKKDKKIIWFDITKKNWKQEVEEKVRTWLNK